MRPPTLADVRLFVTDETGDNVTELTAGGGPVVRFTARDLAATPAGCRRRVCCEGDGDVAVILDLAVARRTGDFRAVGDRRDGAMRGYRRRT